MTITDKMTYGLISLKCKHTIYLTTSHKLLNTAFTANIYTVTKMIALTVVGYKWLSKDLLQDIIFLSKYFVPSSHILCLVKR